MYHLKIETSYKQWTVKHRYSSFRKLHRYFIKKNKNMTLPKFPDKKLFNQDLQVKEARKKYLNDYFKGLYLIFNLELLEDHKFCKFIQVEQSIRDYLLEDYTSYQNKYDEDNDDSSSRSNSADYLAENANNKEVTSDKVIISFLSKMQKYPENKINIIKAFEESFFTQLQLEIDSIKRLFFGDSRDGLLKMAADKDEAYLVSFHLISLIAKLLDPKKNPYSESFKKIFENADTETLEKIVIKMKHYAVMNKGINFEKSHLVKCLDWLQNSSIKSKSKIFKKVHSNAIRLDGSSEKQKLDDMVDNGEETEILKQWKEYSAKESNTNANTKQFQSVVVQKHDKNSNLYQSSKPNKLGSEIDVKNADGKSFLNPSSPNMDGSTDEIDSEMTMPDFDNLPSMLKTKSFNMKAVNDNLNGKSKRFTVMKIIPDDVKEEAADLAKSIAEFLESDFEASALSNFSIPNGLE
jgi:hypothetical protein